MNKYEEIFFQNSISELGIGIANSTFGVALIAFRKISHQYIYINIYMYIQIKQIYIHTYTM